MKKKRTWRIRKERYCWVYVKNGIFGDSSNVTRRKECYKFGRKIPRVYRRTGRDDLRFEVLGRKNTSLEEFRIYVSLREIIRTHRHYY